jgi:Xaa-Pro dipeptidase
MTAVEHRDRVIAAMQDADVDVLLLGREANARYVSGADRLWLAGTRPFAPGCVMVASTGAAHVLSITDDGLPDDIAPQQLYPISWNPMAMLGRISTIEGVAGAHRVGVDGLTPLFEQLISAVLGEVELVDGESLMRRVRRSKSPRDVARVVAAVAAAEAALGAVDAALAPGVSEIELEGAYEEAMTAAGLTTPAFEGTFCVHDPGSPPRVFSTDRRVAGGDLVHVRAGVMREGWEGIVARTLRCGAPQLRSPRLGDVVALCRSGTRVGDVRSTGAAVEGTGMGHEELGEADLLEAGMVLAIEVQGDDILDGAIVHVTDSGPARLSTG